MKASSSEAPSGKARLRWRYRGARLSMLGRKKKGATHYRVAHNSGADAPKTDPTLTFYPDRLLGGGSLERSE
jgi:hypothetical protein